MADHTKASRIAYVTMNPKHDLVRQHLRAGGLACVLEDGINGQMITLYDKGVHVPLLWTHLIPATMEGKALHNVQNAMFAAMMAYALGVKAENIRQGLRTFDTSYFQVPGRTNIFDELPFKVILDYGHNPAAVQAMADFVLRLDCKGRRTCVLAAPGDRRDEDIRAIAQIAAKTFDFVFIKRDDDPRGRGPTEVVDLIKAELIASGMNASQCEIIVDEQAAIDTALARSKRGDLLLVFADKVSRSWKQIVYFKSQFRDEAQTGAATSTAESTTIPRIDATGANSAATQPATIGASAGDETSGHALIFDERGVRLAREQDD